jgi:hypothetical protein
MEHLAHGGGQTTSKEGRSSSRGTHRRGPKEVTNPALARSRAWGGKEPRRHTSRRFGPPSARGLGIPHALRRVAARSVSQATLVPRIVGLSIDRESRLLSTPIHGRIPRVVAPGMEVNHPQAPHLRMLTHRAHVEADTTKRALPAMLSEEVRVAQITAAQADPSVTGKGPSTATAIIKLEEGATQGTAAWHLRVRSSTENTRHAWRDTVQREQRKRHILGRRPPHHQHRSRSRNSHGASEARRCPKTSHDMILR